MNKIQETTIKLETYPLTKLIILNFHKQIMQWLSLMASFMNLKQIKTGGLRRTEKKIFAKKILSPSSKVIMITQLPPFSGAAAIIIES